MFDLDGTLIETAPEICDAVNDTLLYFGLPAVEQEQVAGWIGRGTRELLVQAAAHVRGLTLHEARQSAEMLQWTIEFDRYYQRRCGSRSQIYPQVREVLQALREREVKLAVVTNKEGRFTQALLAAHALAPLFHRVVSGDTLPSKKPDPAGLQSCLCEFGVSVERALFVGDSSIDAQTARNAGVPVWLLPYGYNMGQPVEACRPDRVIRDFSSLLE